MSQAQGHSAVGRIMSMKYSNDTIGNRTRDLPDCSAVRSTTYPLSLCSTTHFTKEIYPFETGYCFLCSDVICSSFLLNTDCVSKSEFVPGYENLNKKYLCLTKGPKYKTGTYKSRITSMRRKTTFRSTTDRIYDCGPIRL